MPSSPEDILRALADPERLAVAGLLARGQWTVAELAEELGLSEQRIRRHLNRLTGTGVASVESDRRTWSLQVESLRAAAREAGPSRDPGLALGAPTEEEERVLRQYFRGGKLTELPAKRSKRLAVLDRLALEFDIGVHYREREVNEVLRRFGDDYATLRRYLVDEGFLSRDRGEYWRSGGRVEL
jgi:DNA-binding transcriptional ArsR family regulator